MHSEWGTNLQFEKSKDLGSPGLSLHSRKHHTSMVLECFQGHGHSPPTEVQTQREAGFSLMRADKKWKIHIHPDMQTSPLVYRHKCVTSLSAGG